MFAEIARSPSLATRAEELIRGAILSGSLPPGAHLVEVRLASELQISRGPIREALKMLAADGLVEIRQGRGAFVVAPTDDEMQDMIVLRAILNGMASRYVATSRDPAVLTRLDAAIGKMRQAVARNDEASFFDGHWDFFDAMYEATNPTLTRAWSSLHGLVDIYVRRMGRPHLELGYILMNYERFLAQFRTGDADETEVLVRSQSLIVGFRVLGRPIPPELAGYTTLYIDERGEIVPFDPVVNSQGRPPRPATATARR